MRIKTKNTHTPAPDQAVNLIIKHYDRDVVYSFKNSDPVEERSADHDPVKRGEVTCFTQRSRRRCRLVLRNIAKHMMFTFGLTYPKDFPVDGRRVKENLHALTMWLNRRGIGYFWIIEFQERGAPHFHGFLTRPRIDDQGNVLITSYVGRDELAAAWNRIISADRPEYLDDPDHLKHGAYLEVIQSQGKMASYFTEYMKKLEQKIVPANYRDVGRYWGFTRTLLDVKVQTVQGDYRELSRMIRLERRMYKAKCRTWGFKWKWHGKGWTFWDYITFSPG